MLRGMVLENFVHFEKRFVLDFSKRENGPNIFVGASSTGKTAVLELIRRCMDRKINSSLTNRFIESETACVFCEFGLEKEKYGPTVISGMIVDGTQTLLENDMEGIEDDEEDEEWVQKVKGDHKDTVFHKVIMHFCETKIKFCSKTYLKKPDGKIVDLRKNVTFDQDFLLRLVDGTGETNENDLIIDGIKKLFDRKFAENVSKEIRQRQKSNNTYDRYPKVWEELQSKFIGVLSMRGLGTFQWTKSLLIDDKFKSVNYKGTCAQAEIIAALIESGDIDRNREHKIFDFLTSGSNFQFVKKSNSDIVVQKDGKEFELLKTSVGTVEAKQFSLLMAHDRLQTICLEEPDRGMHPQMIERMKEVLHQESRNKTIIVVTHSPSLVDSRSLKNTFFFSRGENGSKVVNIYDELEKNEYLKLLGTTEFKTLLFSSSVLFVEGPSDKIVLEAIFRKYRQISKSVADGFPILCHEICSMGGKGIANRIKDFCKKLNIKFCLVTDRDVMIKETGSKIKYRSSFSMPFKEEDCGISTFLEKKFKKFSDDLAENENMFIWKHGELEDFLLSKHQFQICQLLIPKTLSKEENYPVDVTDPKYIDLKGKMNSSLNDGISRDKLDDLAELLIKFEETDRLCTFLKKINVCKYP